MSVSIASNLHQVSATCSDRKNLQIFYANNGTNMSAETAGTTAWVRVLMNRVIYFSSHKYRQIGPSITPLTNLNSGFRVYEVDSSVRLSSHPFFVSNHRVIIKQTFDILDAHTQVIFQFSTRLNFRSTCAEQ